jgi:hypothetical protein
MSPEWIIGLSVFVMVIVTPAVIVIGAISARDDDGDKLGNRRAIMYLVAATLFFGAVYVSAVAAVLR